MGKIISVKSVDIKQGQKNGVMGCMVDLAITRALRAKQVAWGWRTGSADDKFYRVAAKDADRLERLIDKHDSSKTVKPFKFTIVEDK